MIAYFEEMLQKVSPILPAINIDATEMFYRSKLNFKTLRQAGGLVVFNSDIEIHFFKTSDKYLCEQTSFFIFVTNIQDLFLQLSAQDIILPEGTLKNNQWGSMEFEVIDNNGIRLRYVEKNLYDNIH